MLLSGHLLATPVLAGNALLTPPAMDFAAICQKEAPPPEALLRKDWKAAPDVALAALRTEDLLALGNAFLNGTADHAKDPALAAKLFTLAAARPGPTAAKAKLPLAQQYREGNGVTKDAKRAAALLTEALQAGISGAGYELGRMRVVTRDFFEAAELYRRDMATGSPKATLALARLYKERLLDAPSPDIEQRLYTLTQNMILEELAKGNCTALFQMGYIYYDSKLMPRNMRVALQWFEAAAEAGNVDAELMLADLYRRGKGKHARDMARVMELWRSAAAKGAEEAMLALGKAYVLGDGVAADRAAGLAWLEKAAERGAYEAMVLLADAHRGKYGPPEDAKASLRWLEKAAAHPQAQAPVVLALGDAYARIGQRENAFKAFERATRLGDRKAAARLAESYKYGWGVAQNVKKALRFYRLAASLGSTDAMLELSDMYRRGIGPSASAEKANRWLERAAAASNTSAMLLLAMQETDGGRRIDYLQRAVRHKDREAMVTLGLAHLTGNGAKKDKRQARALLERATAQGAEQALGLFALARATFAEEALGRDAAKATALYMQAAELGHDKAMLVLGHLATDPAQAAQWLTRAAAMGNPQAMVRLAETAPEQTAALAWWKQAAEAGNVEAMRVLGRQALSEADEKTGLAWLQRAANLGDVTAMAELGKAYVRRADNAEGRAQALMYLERAAAQGSAGAMREMARIYLRNDPEKSALWLRRAADAGDANAMFELGQAHASGFGAEESAQHAMAWWKRAAEAGHEEARLQLDLTAASGYGARPHHARADAR